MRARVVLVPQEKRLDIGIEATVQELGQVVLDRELQVDVPMDGGTARITLTLETEETDEEDGGTSVPATPDGAPAAPTTGAELPLPVPVGASA